MMLAMILGDSIPVLWVSDDLVGPDENRVEVDQATLDRWKAAWEAFDAIQAEMRAALRRKEDAASADPLQTKGDG